MLTFYDKFSSENSSTLSNLLNRECGWTGSTDGCCRNPPDPQSPMCSTCRLSSCCFVVSQTLTQVKVNKKSEMSLSPLKENKNFIFQY